MKLYSPEATHWYTRSGEPMHTVRCANGNERATDLRDARKLDLVPSATNILNIIAKADLSGWKMEQAVLAALTLPRIPGEALDAFARRAANDALSPTRSAADFGTAFHYGAKRIALNPLELSPSEPLFPWLHAYREWFMQNCERVIWAERVLISDYNGYGGTADLLVQHRKHGLCLVDLKTQAVQPKSLPRIYETWLYQLAAYARAIGQPLTCINLVVNSNIPQVVGEHIWTQEQMTTGWEIFQAAHFIWRHEKDYNPIRRPEVPLAPHVPQAA